MASSEISRVRERSKSRKRLDEIYDDSLNAYVIHYSCESFYAVDGHPGLENSTRVTSIAVRNLKSGQTKTWSIHKSAELKRKLDSLKAMVKANVPLPTQEDSQELAEGIPRHQIAEVLDPLEFDMLQGYFAFIESHPDSTYIHWNMRDDVFGFSALEHRFRVLNGMPSILYDKQKFDLARELIVLYGKNYAPHVSASGKKGRIMSIMEMNEITGSDALQGAGEAQAFVKGEFIKLQQSTLSKVDVISNIFDRAHAKSLKTKATFMDKVGIHPIALIEVVREHILVTSLLSLTTIVTAILKWPEIVAGVRSVF
jgi:hypothetical protein